MSGNRATQPIKPKTLANEPPSVTRASVGRDQFVAQTDFTMPCGQVGEQVVINRRRTVDGWVITYQFTIGPQVSSQAMLAAMTTAQKLLEVHQEGRWTSCSLNLIIGGIKVLKSK